MAQEVTLGGDRLGSGNQMKQELHNYGMNSFNQGRDFKSTMAPGVLYPCFKEIGTNFGTFDIDVDAFVRTLPTKGPLFGSFKMQVDIFNIPFRLYQGILHNNPVDIGMNMNKVYLPVIEIATIDGATAPKLSGATEDDCQINTSALEKYLGLSGIGHQANYTQQDSLVARQLQCVPELGYYDIFKNYYSNKQEENAYVITPGDITLVPETQIIKLQYGIGSEVWDAEINQTYIITNEGQDYISRFRIKAKNYDPTKIIIKLIGTDTENRPLEVENNLDSLLSYGQVIVVREETDEWHDYWISFFFLQEELNFNVNKAITIEIKEETNQNKVYKSNIKLQSFALKNIDKMRAQLLANNELENKVIIKDANKNTNIWGTDSGLDATGYPYSALVRKTEQGITWNAFEMNGLVVKTYQSDIFNNWLDNTLVETIANRTKIDTTSGGFTPDTLILQEKIYKLLNRILVSGGTYYDWQEATYGEGVARMCEIPMYIGGMSTEIMFEEVINNSPSSADGRFQALGSLGGKGMNTNKKGGNNIHVRMDEPGYIMAICSITPRISQSQGNDWDRTELITMDDLHKPELDGIGFQDLMVEHMCWWNTILAPGGTPLVLHRDSVGKQTAWINYQTAVDKVYGDFAKQDGYSFMVLSRNYDHSSSRIFDVSDLTTYIDPAKYNYAFAYDDLAAQNFWVQLNFKCVSRRKMGAQQLPTL